MLRNHVELIRTAPRILLFGALCEFLSSPGQTFFIALFVTSFGIGAGLHVGQLGEIYSLATLGAAGLLPVLGHWIDRIDLRLYVGFAATALALACFAASLASGPVSLLVALLLLRLTGQGLMTHLDVTSVARYFGSRRGLALSLTAMGLPIAIALTPPIAVTLISSLGWRLSYGVIGLFTLCVALPALLWLLSTPHQFSRPPPARHGQFAPRVLDGLRIVVRTRYFWLALPILIYMPFTSTALTFHIEAIGKSKGWSLDLIATAFSAFAVAHGVGLLFSGFFVDRLTARTMLPLMNLPLFIGILALGMSATSLALVVFLACLGISSGLVHTSVGAVWAEVYGVARLGTIRSFATMLMVLGTAAGPAALGFGLSTGLPISTMCWSLLVVGVAASLLAAVGSSVQPREDRRT